MKIQREGFIVGAELTERLTARLSPLQNAGAYTLVFAVSDGETRALSIALSELDAEVASGLRQCHEDGKKLKVTLEWE